VDVGRDGVVAPGALERAGRQQVEQEVVQLIQQLMEAELLMPSNED